MSTKINDKEYTGVLGAIFGIPIVIGVFLSLAAAFIWIAAVLALPAVILGFLIWALIR